MDRDALRALQDPLKRTYRDEPDRARITLSAQGELGADVTLGAVSLSIGVLVRGGGRVRVEGDLDFRGTLAVAKDAPVGFTAIRVAFDLDTDASDEEIATLLRLTERYCVVLQTIANEPELSVSRGVRADR